MLINPVTPQITKAASVTRTPRLAGQVLVPIVGLVESVEECFDGVGGIDEFGGDVRYLNTGRPRRTRRNDQRVLERL